MKVKYFLRVSSLAIHSFSIWLETTFESILRTHHWTPTALSLQSPNSMASYSAMLLVHLSVSLVN
jgi:hypothetical protein